MSVRDYTFTVAQNAQVSDVQDLDGRTVIGFEFPTMTSTSVTLKTGRTSTPVTVGDQDGAFTIVSPSARNVLLNPMLMQVRFFQIATGSQEAAARSIKVLTEDYQG